MKETKQDLKDLIQIDARVAEGLKLDGMPNRYWVIRLNKNKSKAICLGITSKEIERWVEEALEMARKKHEEEKAI